MPSYDYIESAVIFRLDTKTNLGSFKFSERDFARHGDAYKFIIDFFDQYGSFPSVATLCENYPTLDQTSQSVKFDYAVDIFRNQVLTRRVTRVIRAEKELVKENPKQTIANILVGLADIEVDYDEDVKLYDTGGEDRFQQYLERTKKRKMGDGLMGVPTSFETINSTGVGWMPGELISIFARPTVGKTWLCAHAAATALNNNFKTLLISTEMPVESISMRIDVVLGSMLDFKLSHTAIRRGDPINEKEYESFLALANLRNLLICDHISGQYGISIKSIAALIRKHNPEFVIIDGVYLVSTGSSKKAAWEQSHELFYGLKNLATSAKIPIMVSTQANREAGNLFSPPRSDQVAFGDALIRASDVALAMSAIENAADKRLVQFQKYRDGQLPKSSTVMDWGLDVGNIKELPEYEWPDVDSDF